MSNRHRGTAGKESLDCYRNAAFRPFFFFSDTAPTHIYTLSLHDALPILRRCLQPFDFVSKPRQGPNPVSANEQRSEEHTSELQSRFDLVCRLLLEKKNGRERGQSRRQEDYLQGKN